MSLKSLTGLISDVVVPLPIDNVQKSSGLALDIGSTIGKLIYRSNKEYRDGRPIKPQEDPTKGQVHFTMFPRSDVKGMIDYIKDNCDLTGNTEGQIVVNSSGIGGAAFRKDIEGALNCRIAIISEFDCFCNALLALEKVLPEEEMFLPEPPEMKAEMEEQRRKLIALRKASDSMSEAQFLSTEEGHEEDRPRLMVMAGSGSGILQINSDGTFINLDGMWTAGRFMYGLSCVLTGENDFATLSKMAAESDGRTTDIWMSDLMGDSQPDKEQSDNLYDSMDDMLAFPFGKGTTVSAADMKKGDMVWSVFNATALIHAQAVCASVRFSKAKAVYYCGNMFSTRIMRDLLTTNTNKTSALLSGGKHFDYHFLKNGGMYGAMGAFLYVKKSK